KQHINTLKACMTYKPNDLRFGTWFICRLRLAGCLNPNPERSPDCPGRTAASSGFSSDIYIGTTFETAGEAKRAPAITQHRFPENHRARAQSIFIMGNSHSGRPVMVDCVCAICLDAFYRVLSASSSRLLEFDVLGVRDR